MSNDQDGIESPLIFYNRTYIEEQSSASQETKVSTFTTVGSVVYLIMFIFLITFGFPYGVGLFAQKREYERFEMTGVKSKDDPKPKPVLFVQWLTLALVLVSFIFNLFIFFGSVLVVFGEAEKTVSIVTLVLNILIMLVLYVPSSYNLYTSIVWNRPEGLYTGDSWITNGFKRYWPLLGNMLVLFLALLLGFLSLKVKKDDPVEEIRWKNGLMGSGIVFGIFFVFSFGYYCYKYLDKLSIRYFIQCLMIIFLLSFNVLVLWKLLEKPPTVDEQIDAAFEVE